MSFTISIIIVSFNPGYAFDRTMKSLLSQSFRDKEIILVDGDSDDRLSLELFSQYRNDFSVFIKENDNGIYDAMNKGINVSRGEIVTFMNCGDEYVSNHTLSEIVNCFGSSKDLIYGDVYLRNQKGKIFGSLNALALTKVNLALYGTRVVCHQALFVRRKKCPKYSTEYKIKGELNWYFDILAGLSKDSIVHYPKKIVFYEIGGYGYIHFKQNIRERILVVYRKAGILMLLFSTPYIAYTILSRIRSRYHE